MQSLCNLGNFLIIVVERETTVKCFFLIITQGSRSPTQHIKIACFNGSKIGGADQERAHHVYPLKFPQNFPILFLSGIRYLICGYDKE